MYQSLLLLAVANLFTFTSLANVELAHFDVVADKGNVNIEWTTLTETNCEFFVIERSLRFDQWMEITKTQALGSIDSGNNYEFTDTSISKHDVTYTYRISQMNENEIKVVLETMEVFVPNYIGNITDKEIGFADVGTSVITQDRSVTPGAICELSQFKVNKKGRNILINWTTENEEDCYYFVIERQIGNGIWTSIHTEEAKGGLNMTTRYSMMEQVPAYDRLRYQIKVSGVDEGFTTLGSAQIDITNTVVTQPEDEMPTGRSGDSRVDLTDFNATKKSDRAIFTFTTANEQNCHMFSITRSADRLEWEQIDIMRALGAISNKYQMRDLNMLDENAFYRLNVEDVNGNVTILTEMQMTPTPLNDIAVYPNPASELLFIEANDQIDQVTISLSDLDGNVLISINEELPGRNILDVSDIKEGIYVVTITDNKNVITKKIVIDR